MIRVNILPANSHTGLPVVCKLPFLFLAMVATFACSSFAFSQSQREWTDSSGKFKIVGTLLEVKDGNVFLKSKDGKTVKIPVDRLSPADQTFLEKEDNPFEIVEDSMEVAPDRSQSTMPTAPAKDEPSGAGIWQGDYRVDWSRIPQLDPGFGASWNYQPSDNQLDFECQRARLPGKMFGFEGMRRLEVNAMAKRAVIGYTTSFSVPKHVSRVSLVDLPTGRAINSDPVEACNMCPLAILNDGSSILMQGTGSDRDGYETSDQVQIWRVQGKNVSRSPIWIPFPDDAKHFGKSANGKINKGLAVGARNILLKTEDGHLACFDVANREPIWHAKLARNHALELSGDQQHLFLLNEHQLMVVEPLTGKVTSSLTLEDKPHMGWPRIRLSPSGNHLLMSFVGQLRRVDLASGQVDTMVEETNQGPISPNGLLYPEDDFALLNGNQLFHLPSQIMVCDYRDAAVIESEGGVEFVGVLDDQRGLLVPTEMPHPAAREILDKAEKDPSLFLIHPGVSVALDLSGIAGQYRNQVETGLKEIASTAAYQLTNQSDIRLRATISGPEQKAVSYIASGSYIANQYTSKVELVSNGKVVWSRQGTNVPGMIQTKPGQSIQDKLNELGRTPNLHFFSHTALPKLMQAPREGQQQGINALLVSKFTTAGLEDSQ